MKTLNDLLDAAAQQAGAKPALVTSDETISFHELRELVLAASNGMAQRGVGQGD